jgi:hypothetical protein
MPFAPLSLNSARFAHRFQLSLESRNPFLHAAAINFQLRFPRAARPDPACLSGQVMPHPGEARQKILQLSQLDLQPTLPAARTLSKDIEDQLCSIENFARE